ncbi:MAG: hypothetical protein GY763_10400 [Gammaproteobacteria bacterium]|nr:hypothetical protein [Gammaproteobacteria bacterium]
MLNTLTDSFIAVAEIGGNQLLARDESIIERCVALQGRCIAIDLTDIEFTLYCHPGNRGIRLSQHAPQKPIDATISGRLLALFDLVTNDDKAPSSVRERVSFNGDVSVAQQMQKVLSEIDIDWEEILSQYTGDLAAFQITQRVRKSGKWLQQSFQSLMQNKSDFLHRGANLTAAPLELEQFQQQVAKLENDADQCEARIRQLFKTIDKNNKT